MSTPQTASALHHHHFYPPNQHYSGYNAPPVVDYRHTGSAHNSNYSASLVTNNDSPNLRHASTATYATKQPSTNASVAYSAKNSPEMPPPKNARKPNWGAFYANGVPEEIIVIDDDDESTQPAPRPNKRNSNYIDPQPTVAGASAGHNDKRRRIDRPSLHESNHQPTQTVNRHRPWEDDSELSNSTSSRGRSTAANTYSTGQTSLSAGSASQRVTRIENTQPGQKRKRLHERSPDDESEVEIISGRGYVDAYGPYIPPPKPPIKAKDVYVKPVSDKHHNSHKCDDADGHFVVVNGADLTDRYKIIRLLGQGTFGKVVEAYDKQKQMRCAIKIIRAVSKYRDASRIELRVLMTLSSNDKINKNRCIHLRECFDYRNHICIVTDLLSESVFDFLKKNTFTPFPSTHIQSFARQLFTSVAFLHDLNLVHTDLKPENILLVSNAYQTFTYNRTIPSSSRGTPRESKQRKVLFDPEIRLIDFGSATFDDEYHSSVVSTRHYRAPEIILNLGWSHPCDIWSIGCILVEFYTGDALFQTHDNLEHLAMMEAVCNRPIDTHIIEKVRDKARKNSAASFFRPRVYGLNFPNRETPKQSKNFVKQMKRLDETIPRTSDFNVAFVDLLNKIFVYDPKNRITAKQALDHPWFKLAMQDDGTEAKRIQKEKLKSQAYR